jgi:NADPH:quinone reductase
MTMKAVALHRYTTVDQDDCFVDIMVDKPIARGVDILVRVKAVSVNPVDTKVRSPKEKIENPARILGWDASGEVVQVGELCTEFAVGDEVYYAGSITRAGSNSEYQLVDERIAALKPSSLSHIQAAALPLTTLTAWEALFERMDISNVSCAKNTDATLLIIAGAGGVGSIATQLAKHVAKLGKVITTASRAESDAWCKAMGADFSIDSSKPLTPQLAAKGVTQVDYILCCAATEVYFDQMVELIQPQGSICCIVESKAGQPLHMNKLQGKSVKFCWEFMFTRSMYSTKDIEQQHEILKKTASYIDSGVLRSTQSLNMGELNARNLIAAHKQLESGRTIGKVVLQGIATNQ